MGYYETTTNVYSFYISINEQKHKPLIATDIY